MCEPVVPPPGNFPGKAEYPCLLLVTVLTFMGFYCPQPLLASLARSYGTSQPVAGLLMTVTILPFAAAPFVYGRILHWFSLRFTLVAALAGAGICLCLAGLARSFSAVLLWRAVQGLLLPAILVCLTTRLSARYSGRELQIKLAVYAALTMVGAYGGRILAGWLGSELATGTTLLVFGGLQLGAVVPACAVAGAEKPGSHEFRWADVVALARDGGLLSALLIGPVCIFAYSAVLNFLPFHVRGLDGGLSDRGVGLAYLGGLASACVSLGSGRLLKGLRGEWNLLLLGMALFFVFVPMFLVRSYGWACLAMLGASLAFSFIYSHAPGIVNRASRHDAGVTNSVYLGVYYLFSALGSILPVLVYSALGILPFITFLLMVVALDSYLILRTRRNINLR